MSSTWGRGGAVKAGTYHPYNIFRCLFRTKAEKQQNNNTRQEFLDSLKEAFHLQETGQALVRRLSTILGEGVFKPDDYSFDENGRVNCGKPLTARRITAVSNRINVLKNQKNVLKNPEVERKISNAAAKVFSAAQKDVIRLFDQGKIPHITEKQATKIMEDMNLFFNDSDNHGNLFHLYVGLPAGLRYIISTLNLDDPDKENEVYNAFMDNMMDPKNPSHTIYEEHENAINEHYRFAGEERPEMDGLGNVKGHEVKDRPITELLKDLDLPTNATWDDVRKAFKKITFANHPDKIQHLPENEQKILESKFMKAKLAMEGLRLKHEAGLFGNIPS